MVMRAAPGRPRRTRLMPRRGLRCLLGLHAKRKGNYYRLQHEGESWSVFFDYCTRCQRIVSNGHAADSSEPVV